MGYTTKEIFKFVLLFAVFHGLYNIIVIIALYRSDGRTAGWCTDVASSVQFELTGFTGQLAFLSLLSSIWTFKLASNDINALDGISLRKCQRAALLTLVLASWTLVGLYYDVGVLNGRFAELLSSQRGNSFCMASTPFSVHAFTAGWIVQLFAQSAVYFLAKTLLHNLDPEAIDASLFDIGPVTTKKIVSFVRRGRKRILNSIVFAKKFVQRSIRVKTQHDDIFREVTFASSMMRCYTLQELKEAISDRFGMPLQDIRCLLKNGNVVLENDEDVARISNTDYIDVVLGNARPFEQNIPDVAPSFVPVVPRPHYEPVPIYAPFNASLSQIV